MDVDNIEPGLDFVDVLNERVGACEVLLERIPVTFEHSPRAERSSCILVG
jgi:hypothetical protein